MRWATMSFNAPALRSSLPAVAGVGGGTGGIDIGHHILVAVKAQKLAAPEQFGQVDADTDGGGDGMWSDDFDPNTNKPFHLFLLALAFGSLWLTSGASIWVCIPLFAWVMARWIVEGLAYLKRDAEEEATEDLNGVYYAYDDIPVRIYWDDEQTWVRAADVFRVLGKSPDETSRRLIAARSGVHGYGTPGAKTGECFSAPAALAYLAELRDLGASKFSRWLEREVVAVLARQRERRTDNFERNKLQ